MSLVDFQRAFDTIKHITIWKALREKDVPEKIIRMIKILYRDATSCVLHKGQVGEKISIAVGVKQNCVEKKEPLGIQRGLLNRLEDLHYADVLCVFTHSLSDMSQKLLRLHEKANKVDLQIKVTKTKKIKSNTPNCIGYRGVGLYWVHSMQTSQRYRKTGSRMESTGETRHHAESHGIPGEEQ
ncbi:uncharacterized protein LOC115891358 [Sitophilus oryzae]|uniref:Uncharacterized protein LOC115891358 n=1 Tax=Sitophilus oryzae TaxID=7048 RepID=A0A6J2YXW1_SITOR|nr:uncharacterized protein LOC115891358 [Sitophilus oryzae]